MSGPAQLPGARAPGNVALATAPAAAPCAKPATTAAGGTVVPEPTVAAADGDRDASASPRQPAKTSSAGKEDQQTRADAQGQGVLQQQQEGERGKVAGTDSRPRKRGKETGKDNRPRKRRKGIEATDDDITVVVEHGLRIIQPYHFTYQTHAKQRWLGRTLFDVFAKEFQSETPEYYRKAIESGRITINAKQVSPDHIVNHNQLIANRMHRHEPPVTSQPIKIVFQDANVCVVDKPGSIPVHPSGRYRHNTILGILGREANLPGLSPCHRLDRLTSGLLILSKNKATTKGIEAQIQGRTVAKEYICRVRGLFPADPVICDAPIKTQNYKVGVCSVDSAGKECTTTFFLVAHDKDSSVVRCLPKTGRMHQIRVHLQHLGHPILNDPVYNLDVDSSGVQGLPSEWTVDRAIAQRTRTLAQVDSDPANAHNSQGTDWRDSEHYQQGCTECQLWRPHPRPENLYLYLHAWKYSAEGWAYQTDLPFWVSDNCRSKLQA